MGARKVLVVIVAVPTLLGCANSRGAFGAVLGAAAAAAIVGCAASNAQNDCTPALQLCPSGYAHGVDGRCYLRSDDAPVSIPAEPRRSEEVDASSE